MKTMFLAIEVNLIVWIALAGYLFSGSPDTEVVKKLVLAGGCFAALVQHGAYHALRKAKARPI